MIPNPVGKYVFKVKIKDPGTTSMEKVRCMGRGIFLRFSVVPQKIFCSSRDVFKTHINI